MKDKPVIPRALANRDVDEALVWYLNENAAQAALGLVDGLERGRIRTSPVIPLRARPDMRLN